MLSPVYALGIKLERILLDDTSIFRVYKTPYFISRQDDVNPNNANIKGNNISLASQGTRMWILLPGTRFMLVSIKMPHRPIMTYVIITNNTHNVNELANLISMLLSTLPFLFNKTVYHVTADIHNTPKSVHSINKKYIMDNNLMYLNLEI